MLNARSRRAVSALALALSGMLSSSSLPALAATSSTMVVQQAVALEAPAIVIEQCTAPKPEVPLWCPMLPDPTISQVSLLAGILGVPSEINNPAPVMPTTVVTPCFRHGECMDPPFPLPDPTHPRPPFIRYVNGEGEPLLLAQNYWENPPRNGQYISPCHDAPSCTTQNVGSMGPKPGNGTSLPGVPAPSTSGPGQK